MSTFAASLVSRIGLPAGPSRAPGTGRVAPWRWPARAPQPASAASFGRGLARARAQHPEPASSDWLTPLDPFQLPAARTSAARLPDDRTEAPDTRWADLDAWQRAPQPTPETDDAPQARDTATPHPGPGRPTASGTPVCAGLVARLLDGFQLWIGHRPVDLPRGKTRSLMTVLLLNRQRPVSRLRLMRLFWPDAEPEAARNALNVTLHRLRRALGDPGLLVHANDAYQLVVPGTAWIDVEEFLLHAEAGRHCELQGAARQAIRHYDLAALLYCADLLDESEADPTLRAESQALRDRLNQVLDALAGLHETLGQWHPCLQAALRHLQLDTCNETAHQRLMRCYARLGQIQLAERQYRDCVHHLREHLGLSPSEATTALYRRIAARELPAGDTRL